MTEFVLTCQPEFMNKFFNATKGQKFLASKLFPQTSLFPHWGTHAINLFLITATTNGRGGIWSQPYLSKHRFIKKLVSPN